MLMSDSFFQRRRQRVLRVDSGHLALRRPIVKTAALRTAPTV